MLSTGEACVRSCSGLEDGHYQNCRRCSIYVDCTNEHLEEAVCDGDDEEWHEAEKMCKSGSSGTCEMKVVAPNGIGKLAKTRFS